MSARDARDAFREDMRRSPEALESEADRARAEVDRTLEELERRLSPGELLDEILGAVRRNGGGFTANLARQVRDNPVPATLTGIGMLWLMASSDQPSQRDATGSSLADRARSAASAVRDTASRAAQSAANTTRGVRETGEGLTARSRDRMHHLRSDYRRLQQEQPLVLGAMAVALGAAVGTLLPRTEVEHQWLGEASEAVTERTRSQARAGTERETRAAAARAASPPAASHEPPPASHG